MIIISQAVGEVDHSVDLLVIRVQFLAEFLMFLDRIFHGFYYRLAKESE